MEPAAKEQVRVGQVASDLQECGRAESGPARGRNWKRTQAGEDAG